MRSVSLRLADLRHAVIPIGIVGENEHTLVKIDCTKVFDDYPAAVAEMAVVPPRGEIYPVQLSRDGNIIIWEVKNTDLVCEGSGELQLQFVVDETVAESFVGKTRILRSIINNGDVPTAWENWLDEFTQLKEDAEAAETGAEQSASGSEAYAVGKRGGVDVDSDDPTYHNNSKYYRDLAASEASSQIQSITDEGTRQIGLVQGEGTTQTGLVGAEGTRQIGLVEAKGEETIASIPSDYTTLSNDVTNLKSAVDDINDELFDTDEMTEAGSSSNAKLNEDGFSVWESGAKIARYNVTAGSLLKVVCVSYWQFQTTTWTPTPTDTPTKVGDTHPAGTYFITVPQGAPYLVLSVPSGTTYSVATASQKKLDKNQGVANAGKLMAVGSDGNVVPLDSDIEARVTLQTYESGTNILKGLGSVPGYIALNGNISSAGAETKEITYDFVSVNQGETYTLEVSMKGSFWICFGLWQADKTTFVSREASSTAVQSGDYYIGSKTITIPQNVKYIRVSMRTYDDFTAKLYNPNGIEAKLDKTEDGLKQTENLYIEQNATKGSLVANSGNINNQTNYKEWISDYIPAVPNQNITVQIWAQPTSTYKLGYVFCEYNSSKTYLRGSSIEASAQSNYYEDTFKPQNANCAYVRICGRLFDNGHMMINSGEFGTGYMLSWQDVKAAMGAIETAGNNKNALESMNLFIRSDAVVGFINSNGTTIDQETSYREMTSDYMPVAPGATQITAQTWTEDTHNLSMRCVYYNSSKEKISFTDYTQSSTKYIVKTYDLPANTAYIRVASRYLKTDGHMMVNLGNVPMQYMLSWQDVESRFSAMNSGGETGLKNPLLRPAFPRIAMHRGFMSQAPENTLPAFTLAGQAGAWGIETDVWETTDGYFVISHDDDVSRMTDGTGKISEMTYAQTQECTIDAGSNVDQYPNLKMPLLEDYLKICRRYGCVPCIEIKGITNYGNFIDLIKEYGMEGSAVLASYWDETMFNTLRGLTSMPIMIVGTGNFSDIVGYAQRLPDLWIDMVSTYITKENLDLAHASNIPVAGWTYNLSTQIESAVEIGMDIAISESVAKLDNT